jgi:ABC-type glycerol-3-phosphate transport system substrate-binding protein
MRRSTLYILSLVLLVFGLAAAGCGDDDGGGGGGGAASDVSGNVSVSGVWTGQEARSFQKVLDGFEQKYPNVSVKYRPVGDEIPTVLSTAVAGGNPPDVASVAQPGFVRDFVEKDALKPIDFAKDTLDENFSKDVVDVSTVGGKPYGVLFKAANKSTVWYNVPLFDQAGVRPPDDFDAFLDAAKTLKASGTRAYSLGASDGWTLTDLFENIYLRQAGADKYDQLAEHEIPWTDQSVKDALETMAQIVGDEGNIAGGVSGALQTDFPGSVTKAFKEDPEAAMVIEADFVESEIVNSTKSKPETDFNYFDFPSIDGSPPTVLGGGDIVVMFDDSPAARALVEYLATPEAAEIRAKGGGYSSANKNVSETAYEDPLLRETATAIGDAEVFRYDLSDLQPPRFGATVGQGLWKLFQDFLRNPDDVDGITQEMESAAKRAFSGSAGS